MVIGDNIHSFAARKIPAFCFLFSITIMYPEAGHAFLTWPPYGSTIEIIIEDSASNGCWTNISETKSYLKDKLSLLGYNAREVRIEARVNAPAGVTDVKAEAESIVVLKVIGGRIYDLCWGVLNISLQYRTPIFRTDVSYYVPNGSTQMHGTFENNLNKSALQIVENFVRM